MANPLGLIAQEVSPMNPSKPNSLTFQELILRLQKFWAERGCVLQQPYDVEVGAGTMAPETFLRVLGPHPYKVAYVQPSRRPADGRYGENPNRLFKHMQMQVILKPPPERVQEIYLESLEALGIDLRKHDLKFDRARVRWTSPVAAIDFTFEASHPPYAYGSHPRGCPSYAADERIEQAGCATGTITLGGRSIAFEATSHRDHSWGTRDWLAMQHYEWFVGQVGAEIAVHFWHLQALGQTEARGFVNKDGLMAAVVDVDVVVEFDRDYWQRGYTAKITDDAGRLTIVNAKVFCHYTLVPDPAMQLRESGAQAVIDGKQGVGWMEIGWPTTYLDHIKGNGPY